MIFTERHAAMNVAGTKTMTRRVQKEGDYAVWDPAGEKIIAVFRASGRIKYKVGQTYANQPGRSKKANGRIRLLAIREERLLEISPEDIVAEGYPSGDLSTFLRAWDAIVGRAGHHNRNPMVWVLVYEYVQGSEAASASTEAA